jgi:hypothetical protein
MKWKAEMDVREIRFDDGREKVLAQDCAQWRTFVSAALNVRILLPGTNLRTDSYFQGRLKSRLVENSM